LLFNLLILEIGFFNLSYLFCLCAAGLVGVVLFSQKMLVKREASGFRRIFHWIEGVDGLVIGADRKEPVKRTSNGCQVYRLPQASC